MGEIIVTIIIFLSFYGIVYFIKELLKPLVGQINYTREVKESFQLLKEKLENRNFIQNDFLISSEIEKRMNNNKFFDSDIEEIAKQMLLRLGIPTARVKIKTERLIGHFENKHNVGSYQSIIGNECIITIKIKGSFNKNMVLAIIAHEVSHAFLEANNIRYKNLLRNEILTDTCAVYVGFGDIMLKGYSTNILGEKCEKIGYISTNNIKQIKKLISKDVKNKNTKSIMDNNIEKKVEELHYLKKENEKYLLIITDNIINLKLSKKDAFLLKEIFDNKIELYQKYEMASKKYDNKSLDIIIKEFKKNNDLLKKYI